MKKKFAPISVGAIALIMFSGLTSGWPRSLESTPSDSMGEQNQREIVRYLAPVLIAGKTGGRLYYAESCKTNGFALPFPSVSVRAPAETSKGLTAVKDIFRESTNVKVSTGTKGMIRVSIGEPSAAILQTRISFLQLKPVERFTQEKALLAIKGAKEVQAAMRKLRFEEPVTVYSIALQRPMIGESHLPAFLKDVTMDEALDVLAKTFQSIVVVGECTSSSGKHFLRVYTIPLL